MQQKHSTNFVMLFLVLFLSLGLAKREYCHILENSEYPPLSKNGDLIIEAVILIYSDAQIQSLLHAEKPQALICIRYVVTENLML